MTFFAVTAIIMAVSILLIYKLCRYFGLELKWISLVLCAVFALGVNGVTILLSPFLTMGHYLRLTALVMVAAAIVTLVNEYLLKRERKQQLATADGLVLTVEPQEEATWETTLQAAAETPQTPAETPSETDSPALPPETSAPETSSQAAGKPAEKAPEVRQEAGAVLSQRLLEAMKANKLPEKPAKANEPVAEETAESKITAPAAETPVQEEPAKETPAKETPASEAPASEAPAEPPSAPEEKPVAEEKPSAEEMPAAGEEPVAEENAAAEEPPAETPAREESPAEIPAAKPEEDTVPLSAEMDETEAAVAELSTLDDLLDYAYAKKEKSPDAAIIAYQAAIDRYPDDSYTPFLIIELAGLYKERASYNEAINLYAESLGLPIIAGDDAMVQEFSKTLRYLGTVQDILSKHHALATPFSKLAPEILQEIESEFANRQAK